MKYIFDAETAHEGARICSRPRGTRADLMHWFTLRLLGRNEIGEPQWEEAKGVRIMESPDGKKLMIDVDRF